MEQIFLRIRFQQRSGEDSPGWLLAPRTPSAGPRALHPSHSAQYAECSLFFSTPNSFFSRCIYIEQAFPFARFLLFYVVFPDETIAAGGYAAEFPETTDEVDVVSETAEFGDFFDCQFGSGEEEFCV